MRRDTSQILEHNYKQTLQEKFGTESKDYFPRVCIGLQNELHTSYKLYINWIVTHHHVKLNFNIIKSTREI